jgi:chemotaxis family two-component system response regulator Rcp1
MELAVLVVEDNPADASLIRRTIRELDPTIEVTVAPDGPAALAYLQKAAPSTVAPNPALVILDLNIPLVDGYAVLKAARRLPASATTPIVIFSSAAKASGSFDIFIAIPESADVRRNRDSACNLPLFFNL